MANHRAKGNLINTVRASLSVALLLGFYLYAFGMVGGFGAVTVWLIARFPSAVVGKLGYVTLALAGAVIYATWKVLRANPTPAPGLVLTQQRAPRLWAEVLAIATRVGTRAPDEIRLVAEVNAAVSEDARLLGLRSGRRYLYLGVPLLQAMSVAQVRSVLAHELGHYSHQHTRLGELTYRGTHAIVGTIVQVGPTSLAGWMLRGYAAGYRLVSAAVSRSQEIEADRASVRVAGRRAAASALRELPGLSAAWSFYLETYVGWGLDSGYAPDGVLVSFPVFLTARAEELAQIRKEGMAEQRSRWDSHPPIADRIALIEREPLNPAADDERPAGVLLDDLDAVAATTEAAVFDFGGRSRLAFPDFTAAATQWHVQREADVLYRATARLLDSGSTGLGTVLGMLEAGRTDELRRALLRPPQLADPETARELFVSGLGTAIAADAVRAGAARWQHSWSGPATLVDATGAPVPVGELAAAAADGQAAQVRAWLGQRGINLTDTPVGDATTTATGATIVAAITNAVVNGRRRDLIILDTGLIIVPGVPRLKMRQATPRLHRMLTTTSPYELATAAGHRFVAYEELVSAAVTRRFPVSFELVHGSGERLKIRWGAESEEVGSGWESLGRTIGALSHAS